MIDKDLAKIWQLIKEKSIELGFSNISVTDCELSRYISHFKHWLNENYHGSMTYMNNHFDKRTHPEKLVEGTQRVIIVTIPYLTEKYDLKTTITKLNKPSEQAIISRYAWGRDYHKVIRKRLQKLADYISSFFDNHHYRAFTDSAPVLEKPLAEKSGLGVIAKHSNLLTKQGSWFFLGELYTNIPFKAENITESEDLCKKCKACISICPTEAIIAPKVVDAKRCISYLTIENKGPIPIKFRKAIGNRIYGCDDCQLVCPWNRYAKLTTIEDFKTRHSFNQISLLEVFQWDEKTFFKKTEGSAIRRIGYLSWLRNVAVALGNAPYHVDILKVLENQRLLISDEMVIEHINWAIKEQLSKKDKN
ncbi:tRNA epoxyqueuosine(34) reductase QueG [Thiotrichales bacterium 19S3-7]|nr:tRNA epoxyqueuosine(34) reductase QueG [Thiotrichales bacterium 19S3-7]MCF6801815.1 tRNA epoxyqueuosine(34) reductase QueG [Thiotrichales bacterium 19S3-11]